MKLSAFSRDFAPANGCHDWRLPVRWRNVRFVFALLGLSGLTACASLWLAGGLPLMKVAPEILGTRTVEQRLTIVWPGEQRVLEAVLDIQPGKMTVIGLTFGARLFSFDYDGKKITVTQPLPRGMSAQRIINDLLLAYAPLDVLTAALPTDWSVREEQGRRRVFRDEALAISIHYVEGSLWQGRVVLDNHALHYQLTLDSREETADVP
ncbi:MAG: DUF3261 domain-containing protein [Azoarcus sp.]|jgi:hypothetical protein|nr:DUF3261 domain-containing protein [Azoarcus sp.]